jgi:hypothetical protein
MPANCRIARDEVEELQYEDGSRRFFPLDRPWDYFNYQKIKELLYCTCAQCQEDLRLFSDTCELAEYVDRIIGPRDRNDLRRTFISVFGLLVYVEHPLFIIGFLDYDYNDFVLDSWASHPTLPNLIPENWTGKSRRDTAKFDWFARRLKANLPLFAVPHLESAEFALYLYDGRVIMPSVKEVELVNRTAGDGY